MTEHIDISKESGVLHLVIDRPAKKNALTDGMYRALSDALEASEGDPTTRSVLIRSTGPTSTAGNDLGEFAAAATGGEVLQHVGRFLRALVALSKPLVAAVQGQAVGIGTTLLLHCDQVLVAEDAQLVAPFVSLALVPEAASTLLLPARIGHVRAFSMFALGEPVSARDAVAWGLANRVVPSDRLATEADALARRLARQPLGALVATKRLMRDTHAVTRQMEVEAREFLARLTTAEAQEAFLAFAQKRTPDFTKFG